MGFTTPQIMLLVFTVNIGAALGAFSFGYVQDRIGHKPALAITLCGWIVMVLVAYAATTAPVFWVAATLAGLCMGTTQSAGRAMTGALAPAGRLAEFFSLWTFAVQLAAVIGPLTYGLVTWGTHGDHRLAILVTGLFFVGGLALLSRVDMKRGLARRPARIALHCYAGALSACACRWGRRRSGVSRPEPALSGLCVPMRMRAPARILRKVPVRARRYGGGWVIKQQHKQTESPIGDKIMSNAIESVLVETRVFPPPERAAQGAAIPSMDAYNALCAQVENDFDGFWAGQARDNLTWTKPFTQVLDETDAPFYRWFGDGELNVSANCLDATTAR
ncbi:hypothetical protein G6F31_014811 [Rhizopus arrhizus]|nr:hypothetical protein G6F31_014811 [Rhizopus arrhizus]